MRTRNTRTSRKQPRIEIEVSVATLPMKRKRGIRKKRSFRCLSCKKTFRYNSKLKEHIVGVHTMKKYSKSPLTVDTSFLNRQSHKKAQRDHGGPVVLRSSDFESQFFKEHIQKVFSILSKAKKVVIITGAGISVSAGIPAFRTVGSGSKRKNPNEKFFTSSFRDSHPKEFDRFFADMRKLTIDASPTVTHLFLQDLVQKEKCLHWYNQNVDNLENCLRWKSKWDKATVMRTLIYTHGCLSELRCTVCQYVTFYSHVYVDKVVRLGQLLRCPNCLESSAAAKRKLAENLRRSERSKGCGYLKPNITLYEDNDHDLGENIADLMTSDLKRKPDIVLVLGTSLMIKNMVSFINNIKSYSPATKFLNINVESVEWKKEWDFELIGPCD